MYRKHHTKGLVIQGKNEGADSRRISLLTADFGLLNVKAQGARKIGSRLRFGAQDFTLGDFSLVHGKAGWKLVGVRAHKNFFALCQKSGVKIKVIGNVLSLVRKLIGEDQNQKTIFETINNFLEFMVGADDGEVALIECLVLLRVLHLLGYMRHEPELTLPLNSPTIDRIFLEQIAPRRAGLTALINESLKATHLT